MNCTTGNRISKYTSGIVFVFFGGGEIYFITVKCAAEVPTHVHAVLH